MYQTNATIKVFFFFFCSSVSRKGNKGTGIGIVLGWMDIDIYVSKSYYSSPYIHVYMCGKFLPLYMLNDIYGRGPRCAISTKHVASEKI